MTMVAGNSSITESRPKPTRAMEAASSPAVIATAASATIQARVAYSSQKPRRRRRPTSAVELLTGTSLPVLAADHAEGGGADVGAVQAQPDAFDHLGQVLLGQVGVGVGGAGLGAVAERLKSGSQRTGVGGEGAGVGV